MSAIHETAYPRIKPKLTAKELESVFAPTPDELALLDTNTKKTRLVSRLGFMLTLKCYQYLGRIINVKHLDPAIITFVSKKLDIAQTISLDGYDQSAKKRHLKIIRDHLQMNTDKKACRVLMKKVAITAANTKENLADIINCMIDELIKSRFELPAFQNFVRLAMATRHFVNTSYFDKITGALNNDQKILIDNIIAIKSEDELSPELMVWSMLKREPQKPTSYKVRDYISYVNQLKALRKNINIDLDFIPPARIEQLRDEAIIADIDDMKSMRPTKRYALATILIYMKATTAMDDLVQIFIAWVKKIEALAKSKLEEYRLDQAENTDNLILIFYNTLLAMKNNKSAHTRVRSIEKTLDGKTDELIEQCQNYLGLTGDNHIKWLLKPFNNKRHVIYQILENLTILSSSSDKAIERALAFIMHHRQSNQEWIPINHRSVTPPELSILTDAWFKAVTGQNREKNISVDKIHRTFYEVAVCIVLMIDLSCSDAYVEDSYAFDDPNKQYITWEEFNNNIGDFCELVKHPKEPIRFTTAMQVKLQQAAKSVDEKYQENSHLIIADDGLPMLKRAPKKIEPPGLEKMKQMIMDEMPIKNIVDVISEVENWLSISAGFKPLSGFESKIPDYPSRFTATTLSYGCNMGPTQTARSILLYTRKQIAWIFNHHVSEQRLIKAIGKLINHYNLFGLPKHWGSGDSASVDGTFWDMYTDNILAAHHIRYGRYGGVGYYHISDKYIALFSNFISCGAHESIYLLDGIIGNDSDIQPNKIHGDSWAQSEVLFGLSCLLNILIMPRIKNFKHLYFYKASKDNSYQYINDLFTEKAIDWELIEMHYHDMLRIAMSIHKGKIKASTILRRLCSKSRKNKIYFAFRELGRVRCLSRKLSPQAETPFASIVKPLV